MTEGAEILPLKDALRESAGRDMDVTGILDRAWRRSRLDIRALAHLEQVLNSGRKNCGCLEGFLELTAKQHLLNKNEAGIEESIQTGLEALAAARSALGAS